MKDPDQESFGSDSDISDEYPDDFDFVEKAKERVGKFFKGKKKKDKKEKNLNDFLKKNDLKLINSILQRCLETE